MVFIKSMKNLLSKFSRDLGHDLYRIVVKFIGYMIVFLIIGFCATRCTKAMTITDNLRTINETQLEMLKDIGKRSKYKYYVISSDYISSGYNNYTNYYICLTNEQLDISTPNFLNTTCEEIYRYTNNSNNYSMAQVVDKQFKLSNVVYYTNYNNSDKYILYINTIIVLILGSLFVYLILTSILRGVT